MHKSFNPNSGSIPSRLAAAAALASIVASCAASAAAAPIVMTARAVTQPLPIAARSAASQSRTFAFGTRHLASPANCTTKVWISSRWPTPKVIGFNAAPTPVQCTVLYGASPGSPFTNPVGLATDAQGYLYVADGSRVVVFDPSGNYWSTLNVPQSGNTALSVCVARNGTVGVISTYAKIGAIQFYPSRGTQNSTSNPTTALTSAVYLGSGCAFDHQGDFFTPVWGNGVDYLRNTDVNVPSATLATCTLSLCDGTFSGTYTHINSGNLNILSLEDPYNSEIVNLRIVPGAPHQLNFYVWPTHPTTQTGGLPQEFMAQTAPTVGSTNTSRVYMTDPQNTYGNVYYVNNVNIGSNVHLFVGLNGSTVWGVATAPTGQY